MGLARLRLKHVERVLHAMSEAHDISHEAYEGHRRELMWLYLKIEAETLINQGNLHSNKGERVQARIFYQRALNALKKSALQDARKHSRIKELTELLEKQAAPQSTPMM